MLIRSTSLWKSLSFLLRISTTFPLPILLCHRISDICHVSPSYSSMSSIFKLFPRDLSSNFINLFSLDLSGSSRFLELLSSRSHNSVFGFSTFFSMTFSVSSKPSLRSLTSAFYFLHNDLKITTYNVNIFFLPLKFFCKYTFNQKS